MEIFKSPTGNKLSCKGWQQKGLLRLLLNCINLDIAKNPEELVAYGGTRKVARDINSLEAIIEALKTLESDETLLIQSGKPVGIFRTFEFAPRVIMTGDLLVHRWANWDYFRELAEKGLTAYGQSTAGSWAYIGTQGIFQGTWETFSQVAKRHFDGSLRGELVLTSGLSEMGSTKPVAITANGGVAIVVNVDRSVVKKRLISSMIDIMASSLQEACDIAKEYVSRAKSISIGVAGNASDAYEAILSNNIKPDVVKDQTPAHDIKSYIPSGLSPEEARN
ncbi:MAG: urocanate hydratase [Thermoanaerobacteraceae bacterium]|nr:urocanate hydratase [Thermoanaerobacteraceae bacterium]